MRAVATTLASIVALGACDVAGSAKGAADVQPDAARAATVEASGRAFTIRLPDGVVLGTTPQPGPDFEVYTARRGETELAFVYIGNAPDFPSATLPGPLSAATDNPRTMTAPNADGVVRPIEFLWRTRCSWPSYIHAGALGDDTAVTDEAAAIAASVRPAACPQP